MGICLGPTVPDRLKTAILKGFWPLRFGDLKGQNPDLKGEI